MADKPEFVDMISEATQQKRRRVMPRVVEPVVKETSRLSHWPPDRWEQWRMETSDALEAQTLEIQGLGLERFRAPHPSDLIPGRCRWRERRAMTASR